MRNDRNSGSVGGRIALVLLTTLIAVCLGAFMAGFIVFRGPSEALGEAADAKLSDKFILSAIPEMYGYGNKEDEPKAEQLSSETAKPETSAETEPAQNVSATPEVIATPEPTPEPTPDPGPQPDAYGLIDEDGDGIILQKINYKGSIVNVITVLDPTRVFVGTCVDSPEGYGNGKTLDVLCEEYDAIGGINAGGFRDDSGGGSGWPPEGIVYSQGTCYWDVSDGGEVAVLDSNGKLHVGWYEYADCEAMGATDAVSFGPVLISKGKLKDESKLPSGINPRCAIGQREDGAIVMMVADGRQAYSIGITYYDCVIIMDQLGCINATCMDGGNSACMYLNGELVNHPSNQAGGTRYLPDAWLIRK